MLFTSFYLCLTICVIMIIYQWNDKKKSFIFLIPIILIISIRQVQFILFNQTRHTTELAIIFIHVDPFNFLLGPLVFSYFKSIIHGKIIIDKYFLFSLIPSLVIIINSLPYYQLPFEEKVYYSSLKQHENSFNIMDIPLLLFSLNYQRLFLPIYNWSILAYSFLYVFKKNKTKELKPKVASLLFKSIFIAVCFVMPFILQFIISAISSGSLLGFTYKISNANFNYIFFTTLIFPVSIILYPTLLYGSDPNPNILNWVVKYYKKNFQKSFEKFEVKKEKTEDLDRILNYIETKKPYLNNDFSVHDLSRVLNIPQIRISNCFNKQIKIPFPSYRNELRIKHAVKMFREHKHLQMSIEGIATQSGFKTKSAFYAAFNAVHGITPTEWIEKNL